MNPIGQDPDLLPASPEHNGMLPKKGIEDIDSSPTNTNSKPRIDFSQDIPKRSLDAITNQMNKLSLSNTTPPAPGQEISGYFPLQVSKMDMNIPRMPGTYYPSGDLSKMNLDIPRMPGTYYPSGDLSKMNLDIPRMPGMDSLPSNSNTIPPVPSSEDPDTMNIKARITYLCDPDFKDLSASLSDIFAEGHLVLEEDLSEDPPSDLFNDSGNVPHILDLPTRENPDPFMDMDLARFKNPLSPPKFFTSPPPSPNYEGTKPSRLTLSWDSNFDDSKQGG